MQPGFFMDIRSQVADGGERGLLGLAFDPSFDDEPPPVRLLHANGGDIVVARFTTNAGGHATSTRPAPGGLVLIEHSAADEPQRGRAGVQSRRTATCTSASATAAARETRATMAQEKTSTFLGKILRINVNGTGAGTFGRYSVPAQQPVLRVQITGHGEIWAYGLRNPWRITFDRTHRPACWVGDVGQNRYEEIDREMPGSTGGRNYGWSTMEGMHCYTALEVPAGRRYPPDRRVHPHRRQLLDHRRLRLPRADPDEPRRVSTSSPTSAAAGSGRSRHGAPVNRRRRSAPTRNQNITSFGESENGELYAVATVGQRLPGPRQLGRDHGAGLRLGVGPALGAGRGGRAPGAGRIALDLGRCRRGLVERRPDDRGDDPVRIDEDLGRQAVALVRAEDLAGAIEPDGVRELVALGVGRRRRPVTSPGRRPPRAPARGRGIARRPTAGSGPRTGTAGTRSPRS